MSSIRWRAALFASALVAVVLALFLAVTMPAVSRELRANALERSGAVASLVAKPFGISTQSTMRRVQDAAGNPAVVGALDSADARAGAAPVIDRLAAGGRMAVVLVDRSGRTVLSAGQWPAGAAAVPAEASSEPGGLAPLEEHGGRVYMRMTVIGRLSRWRSRSRGSRALGARPASGASRPGSASPSTSHGGPSSARTPA